MALRMESMVVITESPSSQAVNWAPKAVISKYRDQSIHQENLKRLRANWSSAFFSGDIEHLARR
jgi:hypothetical protein